MVKKIINCAQKFYRIFYKLLYQKKNFWSYTSYDLKETDKHILVRCRNAYDVIVTTIQIVINIIA